MMNTDNPCLPQTKLTVPSSAPDKADEEDALACLPACPPSLWFYCIKEYTPCCKATNMYTCRMGPRIEVTNCGGYLIHAMNHRHMRSSELQTNCTTTTSEPLQENMYKHSSHQTNRSQAQPALEQRKCGNKQVHLIIPGQWKCLHNLTVAARTSSLGWRKIQKKSN